MALEVAQQRRPLLQETVDTPLETQPSCDGVFEGLHRFYVVEDQKLTILLLAFCTVGKVVEHVDEQLIDRQRQLLHSLLAAQVCEMADIPDVKDLWLNGLDPRQH